MQMGDEHAAQVLVLQLRRRNAHRRPAARIDEKPFAASHDRRRRSSAIGIRPRIAGTEEDEGEFAACHPERSEGSPD